MGALDVYHYYLLFVETENEKYFDLMGEELMRIINSMIYKIPKYYKEDLIQDILMKVFDIFKSKRFKLKDLDNFLKEIKINNTTNDKKLNDFLDNYLKDNINNKELFLRYKDGNDLEFTKFFKLYVGQVRIVNYIKKICSSKMKEVYNKINSKTFSLNETLPNSKDGTYLEYIDLIVEKEQNGIIISFSNLGLHQSDKDFLQCFIEGDKLLTQLEVANKLNISQQAVSKRFNKIKNRIKSGTG